MEQVKEFRIKEVESMVCDLEMEIEAMERGDVPRCEVRMFELREDIASHNRELARLTGRAG